MIKILFFIESLTGGGAEKVLQTLVNNMDQTQFQITVQTVEPGDAARYLAPGIRYKAINRCRSRLGRRIFSLWLRLCAQLKWIYPLYIRDEYDIEAAYLECGPTKFLSGSTNAKALKLAWVHCDLVRKGFAATKKLRRIYAAYDKVVCVSESTREAFVSLFGQTPPSVVLPNVIDDREIRQKAEAFPVPDNGCFTFVSVGRLAYEKGYDRLLEACAMLKARGHRFCLQILGEGPERPRLEAQIQSLQLQDHVRLLGFCHNPYPYMKAADCIVCSSRYEGLSTVVSEALILGRPIVTTPCSGMEELMGDSGCGLIVPDSAEGLFEGLQEVLTQPCLLRQCACAAQMQGARFSKSEVISLTQQFFLDGLREKKSDPLK